VKNPAFQLPPFSTTIDANVLFLSAVDPNLRLPFTLQWNAAMQRRLSANQTLTATYVGANGSRLLRQDRIYPAPLVSLGIGGSVNVSRNAGFSHYNALQVQFQRRMSHGLQALVSYNLARSSDMGSTDGDGIRAASISDVVLTSLTPSGFDTRYAFVGAVSYGFPCPSWGRSGEAILKGWAVDGLVRITSAPPINVTVRSLSPVFGFHVTQPDIVPGQPFWIADSAQPSGTALNPAAFMPSPTGGIGNFPRNGLRSPYSIDQTDLALRRRFNLTERVNLDVRAEYFNLFNHPMFGLPGSTCNPDTLWGFEGGTARPSFGKVCPGSTANAKDGLNSQSALYAVGGPRSAQFTLKLIF